MAAYYFLMGLLPPLPSVLGDKLAVSLPDILQTVSRYIHPSDDHMIKAYFSLIDAANWERIDQGFGAFLEGGNLTRDEMETRQNLPDFIKVFVDEQERGIYRPHIYDRLWELCYAAILERAEKKGCRFLTDYISWDIELRNTLTALRLRRSRKNVSDYTIVSSIQPFDFTALFSQLQSQSNPLDAERLIDIERLKQIYHYESFDPFSLDAVLAFLSRAFIYSRWEELMTGYDIHSFLYGGG